MTTTLGAVPPQTMQEPPKWSNWEEGAATTRNNTTRYDDGQQQQTTHIKQQTTTTTNNKQLNNEAKAANNNHRTHNAERARIQVSRTSSLLWAPTHLQCHTQSEASQRYDNVSGTHMVIGMCIDTSISMRESASMCTRISERMRMRTVYLHLYTNGVSSQTYALYNLKHVHRPMPNKYAHTHMHAETCKHKLGIQIRTRMNMCTSLRRYPCTCTRFWSVQENVGAPKVGDV